MSELADQQLSAAYLESIRPIIERYEKLASDPLVRWYLFTDGSGQERTPGASCWVLYDKIAGQYFCGAVGNTNTTVARTEMTALAEGLQFLLGKVELPSMAERLPVAWIGDREDIIRSMMLREDGTPLYRRKTNADIWHQIEWFERRLYILPLHRDRNTVAAQAMCDAVSGHLRKFMSAWMTDSGILQDSAQKFLNAPITL